MVQLQSDDGECGQRRALGRLVRWGGCSGSRCSTWALERYRSRRGMGKHGDSSGAWSTVPRDRRSRILGQTTSTHQGSCIVTGHQWRRWVDASRIDGDGQPELMGQSHWQISRSKNGHQLQSDDGSEDQIPDSIPARLAAPSFVEDGVPRYSTEMKGPKSALTRFSDSHAVVSRSVARSRPSSLARSGGRDPLDGSTGAQWARARARARLPRSFGTPPELPQEQIRGHARGQWQKAGRDRRGKISKPDSGARGASCGRQARRGALHRRPSFQMDRSTSYLNRSSRHSFTMTRPSSFLPIKSPSWPRLAATDAPSSRCAG